MAIHGHIPMSITLSCFFSYLTQLRLYANQMQLWKLAVWTLSQLDWLLQAYCSGVCDWWDKHPCPFFTASVCLCNLSKSYLLHVVSTSSNVVCFPFWRWYTALKNMLCSCCVMWNFENYYAVNASCSAFSKHWVQAPVQLLLHIVTIQVSGCTYTVYVHPLTYNCCSLGMWLSYIDCQAFRMDLYNSFSITCIRTRTPNCWVSILGAKVRI